MKIIKVLLSVVLILFFLPALAGSKQSNHQNAQSGWESWVQALRGDAISGGISEYLFNDLFYGMKPNKRVVRFDRTQPEKRLTFLQYRNSRIDPYRIKLGVREYKKNKWLLDSIGTEFGVNPCIIVALWGIESSYGRFKGSFPVIKSLATLAYDGRRSEFFRRELLLALQILEGGHVSLEDFKGEWAGASGHPQFLPSSWMAYAVDHNGDGKKDIWNDYGDVFASIANYLVKNGWQTAKPLSMQIKLPVQFDSDLLGYKVKKTVRQWLRLGIKPAYGQTLPELDSVASVITPHGGPTFMVFNNFRVIMRYNNSTFYAGSVEYLARQIQKKLRKSPVFAKRQ